MSFKSNILGLCFLAILGKEQLSAQEVTRFKPTHEQLIARYKRAAKIDRLTKDAVFHTNVEAHWENDEKSFWYKNVSKGGSTKYIEVDAASGRKQSAFDVNKLTAALRKIGIHADPERLQINRLLKYKDKKILQFEMGGQWFEYTMATQSLRENSNSYTFE